MFTDNSILSVQATAELLGVTHRTVRAYLARKNRPLPHSKPGGKIVIIKKDLDTWLTQHQRR